MDEEINTEINQEEEAEEIAEEEASAEETPEEEASAEETPEEAEVVKTDEKSDVMSIDDIISGKRAGDKTPAWAKERFDKLTREKYALKRDIEEKDKKIRELEAGSEPSTQRPAPPDRFEYDDMEDYSKAMTLWKDKDDLWKNQRAKKENAALAYQQYESEIFANFEKRAGAMRKKYSDFDDSVANFIPEMPDGKHMHLRDELLESELGPELGYYLAKNPKEVRRILSLLPRQITKEIAVLEQRFQTAKKTRSSAPDVIVPIEGTEVSRKDPSKMSDEEWYAWEQKRRKEKIEKKFKGE